MNLVIVESPGKISKIQHILGTDYTVIATKGHFLDLHPKKMSVDIKNKFEPVYIPIKGKESIISSIKKEYQKSKDIFIATDKDREGEMIGWSISHILKIDNPKRIVFNSITKNDILSAVANPSTINMKMVDSQKCRRILDRIVGFSISPLLWNSGLTSKGTNLSAGRVQSVVVKLIIDRENEINEFFKNDKGSYFKISSLFTCSKDESIHLNSVLQHIKTDEDKFTHDISKNLLNDMKNAKYKIKNIINGTKTKSASAPFTTSTLQQEAGKKYGFTVKRTMDCAQRLYESGHITYMRTDSIVLSKEALDECSDFIKKNYGDNYLNIHQYKTKGKNVQEAHEAIRPTHIDVNNISKQNEDDVKLYNLIWCHTIASQMKPAIYKTYNVSISISTMDEYIFTSNIDLLEFDGYLRAYSSVKNSPLTEPKINIDDIVKTDCVTAEQHYAKPTGRYNETSLVNMMDPKNLNIGRPSTYASIINKIKEVGYIEIKDINGIEKDSIFLSLCKNEIKTETHKIYLGKETNKMVPSTLAIDVNNFLVKNFSSIMDYKFTSEMENKLDAVAADECVWFNVLDEFYKTIKPSIDLLLTERKESRVVGMHPVYNSEITAKYSRFGPYISVTHEETTYKAPIKSPLTIENITINDALKLFEYPKLIGEFKEEKIMLQKGKFGIYLLFGKNKIAIKNIDEDKLTLDKAIEIINEKDNKELKTFMVDKTKYVILNGPFGLYINVRTGTKSKNVKLPDKYDVKTITIEEVKEIVSSYKPKKFTQQRNKRCKKSLKTTPK
jgi:DNA topoisomerase-1